MVDTFRSSNSNQAETLVDAVAYRLRQALINGVLAAGAKLVREALAGC